MRWWSPWMNAVLAVLSLILAILMAFTGHYIMAPIELLFAVWNGLVCWALNIQAKVT